MFAGSSAKISVVQKCATGSRDRSNTQSRPRTSVASRRLKLLLTPPGDVMMISGRRTSIPSSDNVALLSCELKRHERLEWNTNRLSFPASLRISAMRDKQDVGGVIQIYKGPLPSPDSNWILVTPYFRTTISITSNQCYVGIGAASGISAHDAATCRCSVRWLRPGSARSSPRRA